MDISYQKFVFNKTIVTIMLIILLIIILRSICVLL